MLEAPAPHPSHNRLLAALPIDVQERLFPYLELADLRWLAVLFEFGQPMRHVYFPTDSIVSPHCVMKSGATTGLLVTGNEGLAGISLVTGGEVAPYHTVVQSAGYAYRLPRVRVKAEFARHGALLELMLRYTQVLITQVSQTAACNRHHTIDQQLCRWLLLTLDRLSHNHLTMTQEFVANMLGIRRESVTEAARKLKAAGVIDSVRGMITVLDRRKLESLSCECYEVVMRETNRLLKYQPQRQSISPAQAKEIPAIVLEAAVARRSRLSAHSRQVTAP